MFFALKDVRRSSPTFGVAVSIWSDAIGVAGFRVPIGVLHGVYAPKGGFLLYGLSALWTGSGEFGCRWNDSELGIEWPCAAPVLSDRDETASSYAELVKTFNAAWS